MNKLRPSGKGKSLAELGNINDVSEKCNHPTVIVKRLRGLEACDEINCEKMW